MVASEEKGDETREGEERAHGTERKRENWGQWEWGSMFYAPGMPGLQAWACSAELAISNLHLNCPGALF